jgi:hypothetical protein
MTDSDGVGVEVTDLEVGGHTDTYSGAAAAMHAGDAAVWCKRQDALAVVRGLRNIFYFLTENRSEKIYLQPYQPTPDLRVPRKYINIYI